MATWCRSQKRMRAARTSSSDAAARQAGEQDVVAEVVGLLQALHGAGGALVLAAAPPRRCRSRGRWRPRRARAADQAGQEREAPSSPRRVRPGSGSRRGCSPMSSHSWRSTSPRGATKQRHVEVVDDDRLDVDGARPAAAAVVVARRDQREAAERRVRLEAPRWRARATRAGTRACRPRGRGSRRAPAGRRGRGRSGSRGRRALEVQRAGCGRAGTGAAGRSRPGRRGRWRPRRAARPAAPSRGCPAARCAAPAAGARRRRRRRRCAEPARLRQPRSPE